MNSCCIICENETIKNSNFTTRCKNCNFYVSKLKNGYGAPVEGINNIRSENFKKIFSLLEDKIPKGDRILEIGPGNGLFMELARRKGIYIEGIEPGAKEAKKLSNKGFKIFNEEFPLSKTDNFSKYECIIFNDVLEHINVLKLKKSIKQCYLLLKKDGFLIINIPNSNGIFFRLSNLLRILKINIFYDRLWQKNFASPHTVYFNDKNLNIFIKKFGFKILEETYLKTIDKNSKKRISYTIKNTFLLNLIYLIIYFFYYLIKFFPKDVMLKIYKK